MFESSVEGRNSWPFLNTSVTAPFAPAFKAELRTERLIFGFVS
jgi:hypothetical protein